METLYDLEQFAFMNTSMFKLTIGDFEFEPIKGINCVIKNITYRDVEDTEQLRKNLYRIFVDNKSKLYEKLYLDNRGCIDFDIVVELIK